MSRDKSTGNCEPGSQKQTPDSSEDVKRGSGGEWHQMAAGEHPALTTNQGVAIADNQNSLKANPQGPTLLEEFVLREKITHFDHERIPERIVHARGTGVHGFFELTASLKKYTTAKILTEVGEKTPLFTRISTVAGGAGSIDTPRDVRGFAVKFYTKEGNWDLVGNNIPVFFIQDAIKFPDLVHALKMEPDRGFPQSATAHEQAHIASALVFELSKVEHGHVRKAIVGHLRHIEEDLAKRVAAGLAFDTMPAAPKAAMPAKELDPSPALQMIGKMKDTLKGRAVGILIADGSDTGLAVVAA